MYSTHTDTCTCTFFLHINVYNNKASQTTDCTCSYYMDTLEFVHLYIVYTCIYMYIQCAHVHCTLYIHEHVHVYTLCTYLLTSSLGMGVVTVQCSLWSGPYTTPAFCSLVRFIRGPRTLNSTLPCGGGGKEQLCIIMYTGNCHEIESGGFW